MLPTNLWLVLVKEEAFPLIEGQQLPWPISLAEIFLVSEREKWAIRPSVTSEQV
jgi:hypothetical protein